MGKSWWYCKRTNTGDHWFHMGSIVEGWQHCLWRGSWQTIMNILKLVAANLAAAAAPSYVASAGTRTTSRTVTVNKPTGTQEGDLMIAVMQASASGVTPTYPSGWTQAILDTTGNSSAAIAYKVAGASEPSSYDFGVGGSFGRCAQIITIRSATTLTVGTFDEGTDTSLVAPSITATAGILLGWFIAESTPTLSSAPSGMTQAIETGGGPVSWIYYQTVASGSTGTKTLTISSFQENRAILVGVY
jgi:hypothetical protein